VKKYRVTFHYTWDVEAEDQEQAHEQAARELQTELNEIYYGVSMQDYVGDMAATVEEMGGTE
jgi:hypothetical protein